MKFFYFTIYNFSIGIFLKSYGYLSFLSFTICELIFILQNKIYNLVSGKLRPGASNMNTNLEVQGNPF